MWQKKWNRLGTSGIVTGEALENLAKGATGKSLLIQKSRAESKESGWNSSLKKSILNLNKK